MWSLIGKVELGQLPSVIGRCALFVGNNSGPHHIAAGLGIPTVGIHSGVVDSREWGPKGPTAVAINRVMTCSPCYLSKLEDCGRDWRVCAAFCQWTYCASVNDCSLRPVGAQRPPDAAELSPGVQRKRD